jgi:hypothetical protein
VYQLIREGIEHGDYVQILFCDNIGIVHGIFLIPWDGTLDWRLLMGRNSSKYG